MAAQHVMRVQVGEEYAKCPYCGSLDFAPEGDGADATLRELACARCGGCASRKLLMDELTSRTARRRGEES